MGEILLTLTLLIFSSKILANDSFDQFPQEIKLEVAKYVAPEQLIELSSTSPLVYKHLNSRWKSLFLQSFGERSLKFFEMDMFKKALKTQYLPGEEETKESIDWRRAYIHVYAKIIPANKSRILENGGSFKTNLRYPLSLFWGLLNKVDLSGQELRSLAGVNLSGANLSNCRLDNIETDFFNTNLSGANLCGAVVSDVFTADVPVSIEWLKAQGAFWTKGNPPVVE